MRVIKDPVAFIAVVGLVVFAIIYILWYEPFSRKALERWAQENGYRVLKREYRVFRKNPFLWANSSMQTVYYVVVVNEQGGKRAAFVGCDDLLLGMFSDRVDVKWVNGEGFVNP